MWLFVSRVTNRSSRRKLRLFFALDNSSNNPQWPGERGEAVCLHKQCPSLLPPSGAGVPQAECISVHAGKGDAQPGSELRVRSGEPKLVLRFCPLSSFKENVCQALQSPGWGLCGISLVPWHSPAFWPAGRSPGACP